MLQTASRARRPPRGYEAVSIDDAVAATHGATLHRPEPGYPVLEIPGGFAFGRWGHAGIAHNRVISELSRYDSVEVLHECAAAAAGPVVTVPGVTAAVGALWPSHNYYHWLVQGLPRVDLVARTVGIDACDRFRLPPDVPPFVTESMAGYGIHRDRVFAAEAGAVVYQCERLVVAGQARRFSDVPRWVCDGLRARYLPRSAAGAPKRVYLGRGTAQHRRVVNEDCVIELLADRGFESLTMDGLTIAEQAAAVSAADWIVGPHGAALANVVFAPRTATLVELVNKNYPVKAFEHLARVMELGYIPLAGTEPALAPWIGAPWQTDADIVADVDALRSVLDDAGVR